MNKSRPSNTKFWILAVVTVIASAVLIALAYPSLHSQSINWATDLNTLAGTEPQALAQADLTAATIIDPADQQSFISLATLQQLAGDNTSALRTLAQAGQGSTATALRIKALMETGRYDQAANLAPMLVTSGAADQSIILAALALASGGFTNQAVSLVSHVSSPQAVRSVQLAAAGKLPLAHVLYATGLLNSSYAMLSDLPSSYDRDILLAHVAGQLNQPKVAVSAAIMAVTIDPASSDAHLLLAKLYLAQGNSSSASKQQQLADLLAKGQP